jgi:hypothetical protein
MWREHSRVYSTWRCLVPAFTARAREGGSDGGQGRIFRRATVIVLVDCVLSLSLFRLSSITIPQRHTIPHDTHASLP